MKQSNTHSETTHLVASEIPLDLLHDGACLLREVPRVLSNCPLCNQGRCSQQVGSEHVVIKRRASVQRISSSNAAPTGDARRMVNASTLGDS